MYCLADTDTTWNDQAHIADSTHTYERNDRALTWLEDAKGTPLYTASRHIRTLKEDNPLKKRWDNMMHTIQDLARRVAIMRHLDV